MNKPIKKAVKCFILDGNNVLAIKYKKHNYRVGWYDILGGKIKKGEHPIQTVIRAVHEKTALNIEEMERKGIIIVEYSDIIFEYEVFVAIKYSGIPTELEENSVEWININELLSKDNVLYSAQMLSPNYIKYIKNDNTDFRMYIHVNSDDKINKIEFENNFFKSSTSEKNGLQLIEKSFKNILSIGISTAGFAEIEMAKLAPYSHIIATTIDNKGLNFTKKIIESKGLSKRINVKLEDVSNKMPYSDNTFDFVYARLVFHYLDNSKFEDALKEIYRVLKPHGLFYIVVRSVNEWEAKLDDVTYDEKTGITKYPIYDFKTDKIRYYFRRFHSEKSLKDFLLKGNFKIKYIKEYKEQLYKDYQRTEKVEFPNTLIECLVEKL